MYFFILFVISLVSFLCAPLCVSYAKKMSIVDVENERSSHCGVVHRGGGILFIVLFYLGALTVYFYNYLEISYYFNALLLGSLTLAITGWFDDYKGLSVRSRFLMQMLAVAFAVYFLPEMNSSLPFLLEKAMLMFAWLWFTNLFNFMDGADGFSTQQAIFICFAILVCTQFQGVLLSILLCSLFGFLRVNYPKAKIFMGDIGSLFLGYILAGILFYYINTQVISLLDAIIITSLFSLDATYTLLKRLFSGKNITQAHREHWYQRFLIAGASHKQLFWVAIAYNFMMLCDLVIAQKNAFLGIGALTLLWASYVLLIRLFEKKIFVFPTVLHPQTPQTNDKPSENGKGQLPI